jgi:hypothetical protein
MMRTLLAMALLFIIPMTVAGCAHGFPQPAAGEVAVTGTVQYLDIEGGFYAIQGDDGVTYDPLDLPSDYRVPGLRVRAVGVVRDDVATIRQVGPVLDIRDIRRIPEGPDIILEGY